jgi:hypothetical protein
MSMSPKRPFPFRLLNLCINFISITRATCPASIILLIILDEEHESPRRAILSIPLILLSQALRVLKQPTDLPCKLITVGFHATRLVGYPIHYINCKLGIQVVLNILIKKFSTELMTSTCA